MPGDGWDEDDRTVVELDPREFEAPTPTVTSSAAAAGRELAAYERGRADRTEEMLRAFRLALEAGGEHPAVINVMCRRYRDWVAKVCGD